MIDQARLRLRRPFLRIEEFKTFGPSGQVDGAFAVFCGLDAPISENYYGLESSGFATREEAEEYIRDYGSDKHIAELEAVHERARLAMARSRTISQLAREAGADDDLPF